MFTSTIEPEQLTATIRSLLTAHLARDAEAALPLFAPDAVVDQDQTSRGAKGILDFLRTAAAEFTYTAELIGTQRIDDEHWMARNRLESDSPRVMVELHYRFAIDGERISELVFA